MLTQGVVPESSVLQSSTRVGIYHTPARETERKCHRSSVPKGAGLFYWEKMTIIQNCISLYEKLINYEYRFVIGRKGKQKELNICFEKYQCFHLLGLQHLIDLNLSRKDRNIIFDELKSGKTPQTFLETSIFYDEIKERILYFPYLEQVLNSNKTVFKHNSSNHQFSLIEADFLLKNEINARNIFLFLGEVKNQKDKYFCRSFFPQYKIDYSKNQTSWTLLYKTKKNLITGEVQELYKNPSYK